MTFENWFIKYHGLAKPEWMNDHRIYMQEAWDAALANKKDAPIQEEASSTRAQHRH